MTLESIQQGDADEYEPLQNENVDNKQDLNQLPQLTKKKYSNMIDRKQFRLEDIYNKVLVQPSFVWLIIQFLNYDFNNNNLKLWIRFFNSFKQSIVPFEEKMNFVIKYFKQQIYSGEVSELTLKISRDAIWQNTFQQLLEINPNNLIFSTFKIQFLNEIGQDQGGLTKEWMTCMVKDLFNPQNGLWALSSNKISIQPSPFSYLVPDHLLQFLIAGRIVGKIFLMQYSLDIDFTKSFLKQILDKEIYVSDIDDIDQEEGKNLRYILYNDITDLYLNFSYIRRYNNIIENVELISGGEQISVTEQNKELYVKLMVANKLKVSINQQIEYFKKGFYDIVKKNQLQLFTEKDLGLALSGMKIIDIQEMSTYLLFDGYDKNSNQIKWLIEILESFSNELRQKFLFFLTGLFKTPFGGFKNQPLRIKNYGSVAFIPVAHTCFNSLDLPPYQTKDMMKKKLEIAVHEGIGFYLG